jgi:hypothetical protein
VRRLQRWFERVTGQRAAKLRMMRRHRYEKCTLRRVREFMEMCDQQLAVETDPLERVRIINAKHLMAMRLLAFIQL